MKKNVLILGGGESLEHEVSLISAKNILKNISLEKYNPYFVGISKKGEWLFGENPIIEINGVDKVKLSPNLQKIRIEDFILKNKISVVFPALHGSKGEDGCIQGLLEVFNLAYVGSSYRSSVVCMDKSWMKILLEKEKIPITPYQAYFSDASIPSFQQVSKELQSQQIVLKASSQGSSIGVSICSNQEELETAWQKVKQIDEKILLEKRIQGRELEIAVLGNKNPLASLAGEIVLNNYDFYSYEAKYIDEKGVGLLAPVELEEEVLQEMQKLAIKSYLALECSGMARVDFFLSKEGLFLNEVNSIPGFTKISMYPKLWQASGISYSDLIGKLIELALERKKLEKKILLVK